MSDIISRAALFNSISTAQDKADIFAAIQSAPAVDAVNVVRCKDCHNGYRIPLEGTIRCMMYNITMCQNDFCSSGVEHKDVFYDPTIANTNSAHWNINPDGYYPYCSACGEEPPGRKMTDYCPSCGAKMKGDTP